VAFVKLFSRFSITTLYFDRPERTGFIRDWCDGRENVRSRRRARSGADAFRVPEIAAASARRDLASWKKLAPASFSHLAARKRRDVGIAATTTTRRYKFVVATFREWTACERSR
jgi:hypothetical protein